MAASPDEGDIHGYPQWDASQAWTSELLRGPFISEWGTHAMPTPQSYRELLSPREAEAVIGPTLLKMDKKAMAAEYPEIMHHWVEFQPDRLAQMLARGSAFDDLTTASLGRFSEAVANSITIPAKRRGSAIPRTAACCCGCGSGHGRTRAFRLSMVWGGRSRFTTM